MNAFSNGLPDSSQTNKQFNFAEDADERLARSHNLGWRLLFVAIISLTLMIVDQISRYTPGETKSPNVLTRTMTHVHSGLKMAVSPFEIAAATPTQAANWLSTTMASRESLQSTNRELENQYLKLSAKLQRLASLEAENARLRELLNASQNSDREVLIAEIVAIASDPYRQQVQLNKGAQQNIYTSQPLIDSNGVIGQISRVDPFSSWAILISDPSHAVPVEIRRNGLRTVARGIGDTNRLSLPFLPVSADIQVGDELWTSGLGGVFPAGYRVGIISEIGRDISGKYAEVYAVPAADLDRRRQLLLLMPDTVEKSTDTNDATAKAEP